MQQFKENHHLKRYFTTGLNSQTLLYLLDSSEMKWKLLQIFLLRFQSRCQICQDIRDLSMKPFCFYSFPQIWQLWWETCGTKLMFEWNITGNISSLQPWKGNLHLHGFRWQMLLSEVTYSAFTSMCSLGIEPLDLGVVGIIIVPHDLQEPLSNKRFPQSLRLQFLCCSLSLS